MTGRHTTVFVVGRRYLGARVAGIADRLRRLAGGDIRVGTGIPVSPTSSCSELPGTGRWSSGLNGLDLQKRVAVDRTDMPIIFITGHGDVPMTVQAMKAGAIEFLTKPFRRTRCCWAPSGTPSSAVVLRSLTRRRHARSVSLPVAQAAANGRSWHWWSPAG